MLIVGVDAMVLHTRGVADNVSLNRPFDWPKGKYYIDNLTTAKYFHTKNYDILPCS